METDFDIAVIGGGPGGATAAFYLAQKGLKVAVFEKEKFPRDHVGESLIPYCFNILEEMGLTGRLKKIASRKPGVNFVDLTGEHESVWCFDRVIEDGSRLSFHMLRAPFDQLLLQRAKEEGAHIFEEHAVKDADLRDESKVSLRVMPANGEERKITARFLIDASGQHTFLAKKFRSKVPCHDLDRVAFFSHWLHARYDSALKGGLIKIIYLGGEKKGWIWVIPVGRNHLSVGLTVNNAYVREQKSKFDPVNWVEEFYLDELKQSPALAAILDGAVPEHAVNVIGDYSYNSTNTFGANYAVIGDACSFLDPIFSSGIYVAMESARKIAVPLAMVTTGDPGKVKEALADIYVSIGKAYDLIEKFVTLFYNDELLNFAHAQPGDDGYNKFLSAYNIFHYLLAGDFFSNHEKYSSFIDTLLKEKNFNQFIHFVQKRANEYPDTDYCRYTFDDVYGDLPESDTVFPGQLKEAVK